MNIENDLFSTGGGNLRENHDFLQFKGMKGYVFRVSQYVHCYYHDNESGRSKGRIFH